MLIALALETTHASGPLHPARLSAALGLIAKLPGAPLAPRGSMRGQDLRLVTSLAPEDNAAAGFLLDFIGQGRLVKGTARGPSAELFAWAFLALASTIKCSLLDSDTGKALDADPERHRAAALAYLATYEAEVTARRRTPSDEDGGAFLRWLVSEDAIALAGEPGALGPELPLEDAPACYEMLIDSAVVDDVFVSERELATLLARFNARRVPPF